MNRLKTIPLFFSTIRHLRQEQIVGQVRIRVKKWLDRQGKFLKSQKVPLYPGCSWNLRTAFSPPGTQENKQDDMLNGRFEFLNCKQNIGWPPQWDNPRLPRLWQYNLHYFEYLWSLDYDQARFLTQNWIQQHRQEPGRVGWEPYPASLRLMNLCGVFWGQYRQKISQDPDFERILWESMFVQAQWLADNLETHILGNHLFENAVALIFTGCCFSGNDAEIWFDTGFAIIKKELEEQILDDGMHFERSPMYHCRIIYLLCLLYTIEKPILRETIERPLIKMICALRRLVHPDGKIALLNDSAWDISNSPASLLSYFEMLMEGLDVNIGNNRYEVFALPDAGYFGAGNDNGDYVICDLGPIGPDYMPGHAHADIFSFELSLCGQQVVVDSGVHDYDIGAMRKYCRSTRAHNTVEIDGENQCELWGVFRVGRRGKPYDVKWFADEENRGFKAEGYHDGYDRLKGKPLHFRKFLWDNRHGILAVSDRMQSKCSHAIISRIHLHPDCKVREVNLNDVIVEAPSVLFKISFQHGLDVTLEKSIYCPTFGKKKDNITITAACKGKNINTGFTVRQV